MALRPRSLALALALFLTAGPLSCSSEHDPDGDADADEDATPDGDGDTDTDVDTDADADEDAAPDGDADADEDGADADGGGPCIEEECDDGVACTVDRCDPSVDACVSVPDHGACGAGELCDPTAGCVAAPSCTDDDVCDDGFHCNGEETCDPSTSTCRGGAPPTCSDGVDCTADICDEASDSCVARPDDAACDDGVGCTVDVCDATEGCRNSADDSLCDDGDYCTGAESCDPTAGCVSGAVPDECLVTCSAVSPSSGSVGVDQLLALTGSAIDPAAHVVLENAADGARTDLGAATVAGDGLSAEVALPAGTIGEGIYTVIVANPHAEAACGTYEGIPALACGEVTPGVISNAVDSTLLLPGGRIETGAAVTFIDVDSGASLAVGTATADPATGFAEVLIAAGAVDAGLYEVLVTNADGEATTCLTTVRVTSLPPPEVSDVIPRSIWEGDPADGILSDEAVSVVGSAFQITPNVTWILVSDPSVRFDAIEVRWVGPDELIAICPAETLDMPVGDYHVLVTNPDGLSGTWLDAAISDLGVFEVTPDQPPRIDSIDPVRSPASTAVSVDVLGAAFDPLAEVALERPDGSLLVLVSSFVDAGHLEATVPGGVLPVGRYPLRVTNPDGRFDVYYVYSATESASGHLTDPFRLLADVALNVPRERLDATWGYDAFGSSYLYAAGGVDDADAVRDDVEVAAVSVFGELAPFSLAEQWGGAASPRVPNAMTSPRQGLVLVRSGRWLYALGGASEVTNTAAAVPALASVERARVMGYETMPEAHRPTALGGSGLPFGTWYYRVSALGPFGESLGSREVQARNVSGTVELCWSSRTAEATAFNVYRSPAADGRGGTTRLIATEVAGPCILDTGRDEWQPAPGRLRSSAEAGGSLAAGIWTYRVTAVVAGLETVAGYRDHLEIVDAAEATASLRWDPVPGATFNVYRSSSPAAAALGDEEAYLLAIGVATNAYTDDGSLAVDEAVPAPDGIAPLPPGSLSRWEALPATPMTSPREGADGIVLTVPSGDLTTEDRSFVYVVGGRPDNSGTGYLDTLERAEVLADGALGSFAVAAEHMVHPRAFPVLLTTLGRNDVPLAPPPEDPGCADFDGDGHRAESCGGDDCDDTDPSVHPGAFDLCGDGLDADCDGVDPTCDCTTPDGDGDGFDSPECGGTDCDDSDATIYPGAPEICEDGIDQDCDGFDLDCDCSEPDQDGDGWLRYECGGQDCDDLDPEAYPGAPEVMCDGIDQDCDGMDDCILASVIAEPIYLIVAQGDDSYDPRGTGNVGRRDFEVCEVFSPDGAIGAWTVEANDSAHFHHGHGAVLYFDYLFSMPGVLRERVGEDPEPDPSATARFPVDVEAADPATILDRYEAAGATPTIARAYYGTVRVNSRIFVLGGNGGAIAGPLSSVEAHAE